MEYSIDNLHIQFGSHLPDFANRIKKADQENIIDRIWSIDHTIWREDPDEIANRLGWLTIAERMQENLEEIRRLTSDLVEVGFTHVLLLGMGGSSLAPDLFSKTFDPAPDRPALTVNVLDSTDADVIQAWREQLPLESTAFIVATKSGGTAETLSLFKYFYNQLLPVIGEDDTGSHFIGITDPGSKLVTLGKKYRFRKVFINDPNIGGRYSVLSYFGLVASVMVGLEVAGLLKSSLDAMEACRSQPAETNPGALLGLALGSLAAAGVDKATFFLSPGISSFGDWVEQLIAESTGKDGTGILPVVHEDIGEAEVYGQDRVFVLIDTRDQPIDERLIQTIDRTGQPVISIRIEDEYGLGGQFFLWEYAIAVAGYVLDINPFDQPNVESAKVRARKMIAEYQEQGSLPEAPVESLSEQTVDDFLGDFNPGDYIAIHAYLPYGEEGFQALQSFRLHLRDRYHLATTLGYGPRFLHSTGQLHKGDGGNGRFIQFVSSSEFNLPIPDEAGSPDSAIDFDTLKHAQALGDAQALQDAGRPVLHFELGKDWLSKFIRVFKE